LQESIDLESDLYIAHKR